MLKVRFDKLLFVFLRTIFFKKEFDGKNKSFLLQFLPFRKCFFAKKMHFTSFFCTKTPIKFTFLTFFRLLIFYGILDSDILNKNMEFEDMKLVKKNMDKNKYAKLCSKSIFEDIILDISKKISYCLKPIGTSGHPVMKGYIRDMMMSLILN